MGSLQNWTSFSKADHEHCHHRHAPANRSLAAESIADEAEQEGTDRRADLGHRKDRAERGFVQT